MTITVRTLMRPLATPAVAVSTVSGAPHGAPDVAYADQTAVHGATVLRGEVEHVRTGERRFFDTYGLLVDVIEQWRLDGADATA